MAHNVKELSGVLGIAPSQILPPSVPVVANLHPVIESVAAEGEVTPVVLESFGIQQEIEQRFPVGMGKVRLVFVNADEVDVSLAIKNFVPIGEKISGLDETFQLVVHSLATKVGEDRIREFERDLIPNNRPQGEPDSELDEMLKAFGKSVVSPEIILYVQDLEVSPNKPVRGQFGRLQATSLATRVRDLSRSDLSRSLRARRVFVLGSYQTIALRQPSLVNSTNNIMPFPVSSSAEPQVRVSYPIQSSEFGRLEDVISNFSSPEDKKAV